MTDLKIGNDTFRVRVEGDPTKPALLLSNSLGTSLGLWDEQMPLFVKHFRVIRYDPRGHGGSTVSERPYSIGQLGVDALAILDALEIEKAHFAGISMGGTVGLWLMLHAPDRLDRVVLANTAARLGNEDNWNARILSVLQTGMDENATATIERWFSPEFTAANQDRVDAIRDGLRMTPIVGYAGACAALRDLDFRQALPGLSHPTLVISGTHDPVVSPSAVQTLVEGLPNAKHIALDALHISCIEAKDAFGKAVVAFLSAKERGRTPRATPAARSGRVGRASPARQPLRAASTSRKGPAKRPGKKTSATKTVSRRRPAKKAVPRTGGRKAAARSVVRTRKGVAEAGTVAKKRAKAAATTRRPTKTPAARGVVKKTAVKAANKPRKVAAKTAGKKGAARKMPTTRRKPLKTPRRPKGRRK